jgi:hypothetical protein
MRLHKPRVPTAKRISRYLLVSNAVANELRKCMLAPSTSAELTLQACNGILDRAGYMYFGVEYMQKGKGRNSPAFMYLNSGDSYCSTIVFINGNFQISSWGDIVEGGNYA